MDLSATHYTYFMIVNNLDYSHGSLLDAEL